MATFFLIDDDSVDVMAFKRALRKHGRKNELVVAESAEQALQMLQPQVAIQEESVIFLLDLNMPGVGGLGFLEQVRNDEKLRKSVVFVFTSSDSQVDIDKAYELNVAGYVVKSRTGPDMSLLFKLLDEYENSVELPKISIS